MNVDGVTGLGSQIKALIYRYNGSVVGLLVGRNALFQTCGKIVLGVFNPTVQGLGVISIVIRCHPKSPEGILAGPLGSFRRVTAAVVHYLFIAAAPSAVGRILNIIEI